MKKAPFEILDEQTLEAPGWVLFGCTDTREALPPLTIHRHDFIEMVFIAGGTQVYEAGGRIYPLRAGEGFLSRAGEAHSSSGHPQAPALFYWIQLDPSRPDFLGLAPPHAEALRQALTGFEGSTFTFPLSAKTALARIFAAVKAGSPLQRHHAVSRLRSLLYTVLCREEVGGTAGAGDAAAAGAGMSADIARAAEHIGAHPEETLSLETLAGLAHLSLARFKVRFRQEVGEPPRAYINGVRMERAKALLREGQCVTDVALRLGFDTPNYFATVFKKHTAMTPSAWRAARKEI
ncbi:MAG: AraC family transcriptional regulator [Oscillospiraceae bacterium]|nr:AraC family transcriptional regulator [Oscillospiraceae bacterium]